MRRGSSALHSCFLGLWLVAPSAPITPPTERIEVRLAQFDVVVRDKSGAIVSGLGAADFTVLEDGSPMEIVAVDEWGRPRSPTTAVTPTSPSPGGAGPTTAPATSETAAAPTATEQRSFVLIFDALGDSTALRMNQAKRAAAKFFREHLRPEDSAIVYQLDLSLRPMSGITSNSDELARSIDKVSWMAASHIQDDIAESIVSSAMKSNASYMADRLSQLSVNAAQELDWQREHVYSSLNDLAEVFRALPGRRVLVLVSPGFPLTTAGDQKSGSGGFTPRFRDLIRSYASYGVTVYSLDIGNDLAAGDVSETIDWRVAVGKLGMDENALANLGLERSLGTSTASARREFLGVLASETGGRLLTQTDLSKAFDAIQEESARFYRISCRVSVTPSGNRYRSLQVKVKTPGYSVITRRGRYSDISPNEKMPPSGAASVESIAKYKPLAARGIATPLPGGDGKKIPVAVVVEALGPIDLPTDAQGVAALDVDFHLVARAAGEIVDRYERSFTARVKPDGVNAIRRAFRLEGRLMLVPGVYDFQGSVRLGTPAQLASWSATVAVPPLPKGAAPAFAGVILSADEAFEAPLLSRPTIADDVDPLVLKPGARILPAAHNDFESGGGLNVLFWLRGFPEPGDKPPSLDLTVAVEDQAGKSVSLPTSLLFFGKDPAGGYRALARVETSALSTGSYSLKLAASVPGSGVPPARHAVTFTLRARESASAATSSSAPTP